MRYTANAMIHATAVLYNTENTPYFHEPVSRTMAVTVAIQGQ